MPRYESTPLYEHGSPESLGVLLVNLGTPDDPSPASVRRYLRQFLSDPRVVELPRLLWWLILEGVILRVRPSRSAEAYQKIWTDEGSPLLLHSQDVVNALNEELPKRLSGSVHVELAMTYRNPSIPDALDRLYQKQAKRVLVVPMYPQYSNTTTGSVFEAVTQAMTRRRWIPELRFVNHYHDEQDYIAALAASVRDHWETNGRGERLLFSFHGVPRRTLLSGDPYHCHCQKTARMVADALGVGRRRIGRSAFSRASVARNGLNPTRTRLWNCGDATASVISMLSVRRFPSTAWRRSRRYRWKARTSSPRLVEASCGTSPA